MQSHREVDYNHSPSQVEQFRPQNQDQHHEGGKNCHGQSHFAQWPQEINGGSGGIQPLLSSRRALHSECECACGAAFPLPRRQGRLGPLVLVNRHSEQARVFLHRLQGQAFLGVVLQAGQVLEGALLHVGVLEEELSTLSAAWLKNATMPPL